MMRTAKSQNLDDRNNPDLRRLMALCGLKHRFVRGEGAWLTAADGRCFLDGYAQFGAVLLGLAGSRSIFG